ncbi:MAG: hypothetical protein JWQ34_313 [Mucilaginibacter sp.]|nr:hypothetical protein [Mucilaginibacter sp.]MDB5002088.1 hypothetical protein [Mucilaginibacter sp.]
MKKQILLLFLLLIAFTNKTFAQYSGSFIVHGDLGKYYPVLFNDVS